METSGLVIHAEYEAQEFILATNQLVPVNDSLLHEDEVARARDYRFC